MLLSGSGLDSLSAKPSNSVGHATLEVHGELEHEVSGDELSIAHRLDLHTQGTPGQMMWVKRHLLLQADCLLQSEWLDSAAGPCRLGKITVEWCH